MIHRDAPPPRGRQAAIWAEGGNHLAARNSVIPPAAILDAAGQGAGGRDGRLGIDPCAAGRCADQAAGYILLVFGLTCLGIVIAGRIRSFEGFGIFSNALILTIYFLSSSIFPLDPALSRAQAVISYPEWLVTLVEWNPMTYAVDALRGTFLGYTQFDPALGPMVRAGMCVLFFLLAWLEFRRG